MKTACALLLLLTLSACASTPFSTTVKQVDTARFMGEWYILAGRFTAFEKEVYNSRENFSWNEKENRVDIDFSYRFGDFSGEHKSLPQKAHIKNSPINTRWDVQPFWPLHFEHVIVALADDYSWAAIGVPDQKYLWIVARDWKNPSSSIDKAMSALRATGYSIQNLIEVPQKWP